MRDYGQWITGHGKAAEQSNNPNPVVGNSATHSVKPQHRRSEPDQSARLVPVCGFGLLAESYDGPAFIVPTACVSFLTCLNNSICSPASRICSATSYAVRLR